MKLKHSGNPNFGELGSSEPKQYAQHQEALRIAEELDKEDIFDKLLIPDTDYAYREYPSKNGSRGIGIKIDPNIHSNRSPILPHQQNAVRHFLSKFRGVGILADEVGMGKTLEAGMVISELAERKSIGSLLVVAENLDNWHNTLQNMFGIQDLTLVDSGKDIVQNCEFKVPLRPLMISMKNFCNLQLMGLDMCFDAVVVDEAHNFGMLEECKRGMYVLSHFMKAKQKANKPYCILVSGTPHNGTLDSMFPLWYFVTSRGNVGEAFNPDKKASDRESTAMAKAHRHYHEHLCNGANTIAEFIESFKIDYLRVSDDFHDYVAKNGDPRKSGKKDYDLIGDYTLRTEFLDEHKDVEKEIRARTNNSYKSLIESFMIRQSRRAVARQTEKRALNYYFCPTRYAREEQHAKIRLQSNTFRTDADSLAGRELSLSVNCADYYGEGAVGFKGNLYSLDAFVRHIYDEGEMRERGIGAENERHREKMNIIFDSLDGLGAFSSFRSGTPEDTRFAQMAEKYYYDTFKTYNRLVDNRIELIDADKSVFDEKAEKLVQIANNDDFKKKRIIVFFDYYSRDAEAREEPQKLYAWLKEHAPNVYKRTIFAGKYADSDKAASAFVGDKSGCAILLADEKLSESHNLQYACSTVINFSICYSPIKMDQRIGRVDRIGQQRTMNIISFANMNSLEGFLLAFYNKIGLFSGWRDDIILVTGCDNENSSMKRCADCEMVVLSLDNSSACPNCQGALHDLENTTDYSCNQCDFTLKRTKIGNSYAYVCPERGGKPLVGTAGESNRGLYRCDKKCLLQHCSMITQDNCEVMRMLQKNYNCDINKLYMTCHICTQSGSNACPNCSLNTGFEKCVKKCPTPSNLRCAPYSVTAAAGADCPQCKPARRGGKLVANTPTTFDSFAKFIWTLNDFVKNFEFESGKIYEILETLRTETEE